MRNDTPSPNLMEKPLSRCQLEDLLQWVDGDGEEKWEERAPLPQATPMLDGWAGHPIQEYPRRREAKEGCNPVSKLASEPSPLEEI